MRLTIVRDGERSTVEVAADLASVVVEGHRFPVKVVGRRPTRVELELAGEKVMVDDWPDHFPSPPTPVTVDGERWTVEVSETNAGPGPPLAAGAPPAAPGPLAPSPARPPPTGGALAVVPPMPGKVVELRVREGERVEKGQVLLVLEAMKMRNEVPSPAAGTVQGLTVATGANVRAHEPMLYVAPG